MSNRVRIAENVEEISKWRGPAVVLDILRFSTTVSQLALQHRPAIRVFREPADLTRYAEGAPQRGDIFSELEFERQLGFPYHDNSPHLARSVGIRDKEAWICTRSGSKAAIDLSGADPVWIGCFAVFSDLITQLRAFQNEILLAPACLYSDLSHLEDFECAYAIADALTGKDTVAERIENVFKTNRIDRFRKARPATAEKDLEIVFSVDSLGHAPRLRFAGKAATVVP